MDALPMWTSDPTVDRENWRTYSYCDTAEGTKQQTYITDFMYYIVKTTLMGLFQHVSMVLYPEKCLELLKFSCVQNFFYCAQAWVQKHKNNGSVIHDTIAHRMNVYIIHKTTMQRSIHVTDTH